MLVRRTGTTGTRWHPDFLISVFAAQRRDFFEAPRPGLAPDSRTRNRFHCMWAGFDGMSPCREIELATGGGELEGRRRL